jgi:hypothetical protein
MSREIAAQSVFIRSCSYRGLNYPPRFNEMSGQGSDLKGLAIVLLERVPDLSVEGNPAGVRPYEFPREGTWHYRRIFSRVKRRSLEDL